MGKTDNKPLNSDANQGDALNKEGKTEKNKISKKKKIIVGIAIAVVVILLVGAGILIAISSSRRKETPIANVVSDDIEEIEEIEEVEEVQKRDITIAGNGLDEFDLHFVKAENDGSKNIIYSPLSIKYALNMLNEGTGGESKAQIENVLGSYNFKKYQNSENLSLANALFVNSAKTDKIKNNYITSLKDKFDAELIFDDFYTPDNINSWISDKTFELVKDILGPADMDPNYGYFYLVNALAIDMDWENEIQLTDETAKKEGKNFYNVSFRYENFPTQRVGYFEYEPGIVRFSNQDTDYIASEIAATANKYDIVEELGEDNIRSEVQKDYEEWAAKMAGICSEEQIKENAPDLDDYVNTLDQHYGYLNSSTDFEFYNNDNVLVFAKDLKTYDDTTLQYIGIMPKTASLTSFLKSASAQRVSKLISKLKPIELSSFENGVVTRLTGAIPHFSFDYDLKLQDDLELIGIEDIFDDKKADLSGITDEGGVYIKKAKHKANIEFSNSGIKAGAATVFAGGLGGGGDCSFYHSFDVPVEEINLTFNKPYLFLIRDKDSGEVWFVGAVYQPKEAEMKM